MNLTQKPPGWHSLAPPLELPAAVQPGPVRRPSGQRLPGTGRLLPGQGQSELTTFQDDGIPVSTHVDGVVNGDRAYFRVWRQSDTAKRLRRTDDVQVTACPIRGLTVGPPLDAVTRLLTYEAAAGQDLGPSRPGEGLGLGSLLP